MAPRRAVTSKVSKTAPTKARAKPSTSITFERPEQPFLAALPPTRVHSPSYHFPLLVENQSQQDALLDWFKSVEDSRTMPWRKAWIDRTQISTSEEDADQIMNKRAYEVWVSEISKSADVSSDEYL